MYFPYFRGRQNELLCLRELLDEDKINKKIIPIIEPVKYSSTFFSTISNFIEKNREIIIVVNPKVGAFYNEYSEMREKIIEEEDVIKREKMQKNLDNYHNIWETKDLLKAYILDDDIYRKIISDDIDINNITIINCDKGNYHLYEENADKLYGKYNIIPKGGDYEDIIEDNIIVLEDGFNKAKRNLDYIKKPDELFSRNHLIYRKRGFDGFSDYSIVGNEFEEAGFAPLAIAIHIMYFGVRGELRVHHFVSESNETLSDPARKFEEAMTALLKWEDFDSIPKTMGLNKLIECYNIGKFPGLGVIKQYSLMHHMQMMSDYLEDK